MTAFTEISVRVDGEAAEVVAEVLRPFAYQDGVVLEQMGDEHDPEPLALEPIVTVKIFVPQEDDTPELRQKIEEILYHLNRLYPVPAPHFKILEETDWANAWKEHYHPFRVGQSIWIQPSWHSSEETTDENGETLKPDDVVLVLDPGMAFGTGLHPTTQKCLRALEQIIQPGDRVLDVGTGSGILSIAAVKLGAASAVGIDTDEIAVKSAVANAAMNDVNEKITFWRGDLRTVSDREWDVIVVNILAPIIMGMLKQDNLISYLRPKGLLVLSGIIDTQIADVENVLKSVGGTVIEKLTVRDWVTLIVRSA